MTDSHLLTWIVGVIFAAGGAWVLLKQVRKQADETRRELNGLGASMRKKERNMLLALMVICEKKEDRVLLANYLKE